LNLTAKPAWFIMTGERMGDACRSRRTGCAGHITARLVFIRTVGLENRK
jgi:hypothetical protein